MKYYKFYFIFLFLFAPFPLLCQNVLTAEQSDPNTMGWMQGFPPPQEKIISAIEGTFFKFPALRYSVCHMRQFMPTTIVKAARSNNHKFEIKIDEAIDNITFMPTDGNDTMT